MEGKKQVRMVWRKKEGKEGGGVEKRERDGNEPDSRAVLRSLAEMKSKFFESCRESFAEGHSFLEEEWDGDGGEREKRKRSTALVLFSSELRFETVEFRQQESRADLNPPSASNRDPSLSTSTIYPAPINHQTMSQPPPQQFKAVSTSPQTQERRERKRAGLIISSFLLCPLDRQM